MHRARFGSGSAGFDGSRRRFLQRLAGATLIASAARRAGLAGARAGGVVSEGLRGGRRGAPAGIAPGALLSGVDFDLQVDSRVIAITGASRWATLVNGRLPAPLLYWRQGDTIRVRVSNRLRTPTSLHWHGILVPAAMDGVPGLSFAGIAPGSSFEYRFRLEQAGTYWYHSHSRFQEQVGLYGPIVIAPADGERYAADREHVLLLSDWTDHDPEQIYRTLKRDSEYFNYSQRTAADFLADAHRMGWSAAMAERRMWGSMRMSPTDILDVSGHAYTYLLNGITPTGNWTGLFAPGETLRLRIINGSSMSFFDLRIPGLMLTVIAADGQDVDPVTVEELRIGAGEVYDVLVQPRESRAYTIFAQAMDRSGFARGTLAPAAGMVAQTPTMDARVELSMDDMGMGMGMESGAGDMRREPRAERFGPNVDPLPGNPRTRLDDPGVGLRDNGRRVLTYADLRTVGGSVDPRPPSREIRLHLTGHMQRYVWSFDGQKFSEATPLQFHYGERLRLVLVNDTMMTHPIHLHGMWSEIEAADGGFLFRKHTVSVQPGQLLAMAVSANAPGRWAFHCHLLYHMEAGMFREVSVRGEIRS